MNAVEQLEMKQVGASKGEMGGWGNGREKEERGREIRERWLTGLYELLSLDMNAAQHLDEPGLEGGREE